MITVLSGPRILLAVFSIMSRGGSLSLRVEIVHHYIPHPNSKMQNVEVRKYSPSLSRHKLGGRVHTLLTIQCQNFIARPHLATIESEKCIYYIVLCPPKIFVTLKRTGSIVWR